MFHICLYVSQYVNVSLIDVSHLRNVILRVRALVNFLLGA